jgi:hypothetical protein
MTSGDAAGVPPLDPPVAANLIALVAGYEVSVE